MTVKPNRNEVINRAAKSLDEDIAELTSIFRNDINSQIWSHKILSTNKMQICVSFQATREATVPEFLLLKEYAESNCYEFHEELRSYAGNVKHYWYYLTLYLDVPF